MACRRLITALCIGGAGASQLRALPATTADSDCPYGYGDGCDNFWDNAGGVPSQRKDIDPATKAKVLDILGGLIGNLQSKPVPRLVSVKTSVVRSSSALDGDKTTAKVLGSLLSVLQRRSQASCAALLSKLAGEKVDEQSVMSVEGLMADVMASKSAGIGDICPFGYGCGGGGTIDGATKDKVANILKGIIKNMSGHKKALVQVDLSASEAEVRRMLGSLLSSLRSSHKAKAAEVVENLVGAKVEDTQSLADLMEQGMQSNKSNSKSTDPCRDFGYGCGGGGGPISPATRDQVANILKGIIGQMTRR